MPTVAELYHGYVGRKAMLRVLDAPEVKHHDGTIKSRGSLGIEVPVWIRDARTAFGNPQVLIEPEFGEGSTWVMLNENVRIVEEFPYGPASTSDESVATGPDSQ